MTRDSENSTDSAWIQKYLDVAGVILVAINRDETVRLINRKGCEVLEGSEEQIVGQNWFDLFVPANQRETVREFFRRMCEGEEDLPEYYENPVLTLGGQEKLVAWHNTILSEPDGTVVGSLSSGKDVTETRKGEEALRRSEAKLRAIVDTAVDGIITIDSHGVVQSFNNAASKLFGYSPEEIVGRNVSNLMPEPDSSRHNQYIDNYLRTGQAKVMGNGREVLAQRKDGTTFPIYLAISEMSLRDSTLFAGIVHDLSEIKRMQEQVSQSQNLAAIGEMAATVAHEIKNPLAGISGAIQVLRDTLDTEDPRYQVMGEVLAQVQRLDETVRQLLMLSKPWKPSKEVCDLRLLAEQIYSFAMEQETFSQISFSFSGDSELLAPVDPTLFEQVLWNLLDNSSHAMSSEGSIQIRFCRQDGVASIQIHDSGVGIPSEIQSRLFQPFVTTKTHGTGLGLAICKKIMDSHQGSILIENPIDGGTRVILEFPREDPENGLR